MLSNLRIQNFALIDQVAIDFNAGFTVLTGETGSGKSILLGALNLILGERADYTVIGPNGDKSIVEAEFELKNFHLNSFFEENDIDNFDTTIIRREITKQGRSRAFVNDTPVPLNILKELTEKLIHIHSQHHTIELKSAYFQTELLDTLSALQKEKGLYQKQYISWVEKTKLLTILKDNLSKSIQIADYNRFQLDEIEELNLDKKSYSEIEKELNVIENIDEIKTVLENIHLTIDDEEGIIQKLNKLKNHSERIKGKDSLVDELTNRINSIIIDLKDISNDAESHKEGIEYNPFKINELTLMLDKYNRVLKKHGLKTQTELINYSNSISIELESTVSLQNQINNLQLEIELNQNELFLLAKEMHSQRIANSIPIAKEIEKLLEELKMPSTQFIFQVLERKDLNLNGISEVSILFSPNIGIEPIAIDKAASGGELSRLMLALQNLISKKKQLPSIIFDEIDTGVSGDVAQKMGALLKNMGANLQLIAISHLPQVAGKAQNHYKVEKAILNNSMKSTVRKLNENERIEEIARLMSGEEINEAALLNAKALMQ
ncbi:MAG: DNA repair protein RecN [Flavobacteriia bacterium]|nr:DNA repair protein RecN [Flavobacteriia bacterium]